jgi:tRNA threonylcarbamoyladenosine biosynthesis protein TsaB
VILAFETATPAGSIALVSGEDVLAEEALSRGRQASETFLAAVRELLLRAGRKAGDVACVAASAGPGSFTGLRVGMAAAKGFCFGLGVPIVAVPTLHALALTARGAGEAFTVCPVLDARKKEVYAAFFRREKDACLRLTPDMAVAPEALLDRLPQGRVMFLGDGGGLFGPFFRARLGDRAVFPSAGEGLPSAGAVGRLAFRLAGEGRAKDPRSAVPAYIRRSEAETRRTA